MTLVPLIRESRWSEVEDAWTELIKAEAPMEPAMEAVNAAAHKKEIPRLLPLIREHAESLAKSGKPEQAAELLGTAMMLGGSPGELAKPLFLAAEAAYGTESFWEVYCDIADLRENVPDMRSSWRDFRKLLGLEPGRVLYHPKGWGLAVVEGLHPEAGEAALRFASGRRDRFPFQTAVDIFEFLEPHDLRALVVLDPEELARIVKKEPLEVLRWILKRNKGQATQAGIKLAMGTLGIDGGKFTAWWRKAKKQAETSEWFQLSGPANRTSVRLLDRATDPAEGIRTQLKRSPNLHQALQRVRQLVVGGAADEAVLSAGVETLAELVEDGNHPLPQRLATWLFLKDRQGATPESLVELLREAAEQPDPESVSQPPALWATFQLVPGTREQEKCVELLREVYPDDWLDLSARFLQHAAPGMVRPLVEALESAGRTPELIAHYNALVARPTKNPILLVRLAENLETDEHDDTLVPRLQRVQCLLQLGAHAFRHSARDTTLARTRTRLSSVLTAGDPPLLRRLIGKANVETLRSLAAMIDSGIDRDIDRLFTQVAIGLSPDVFVGEERPFWEGSVIWTSREGLSKHSEELRILKEVKIPANAEAIGKAASYGDLSENSEWEAAIEEQRNLTNRAMALEAEIAQAQLIENAPISSEVASPGTRVSYREVASGEEHRVELVGPWDVLEDQHVSYRSPLGTGLLGKQKGEHATLSLPTGELEVELLSIEPLS